MKIAICDDNWVFLSTLQAELERIKKPEDEVTCFFNGNDLIDFLRGQKQYPFDLTILDIKMPGMTGLDVAGHIRCISKTAHIAILTEYIEFAFKAYSIKAYDYIVKPVTPKRIKKLLDDVRERLPLPKTLYLSGNGIFQEIEIDVIRYVEISGYTLNVYTKNGKYTGYGKISDVFETLKHHKFYQIHRGIIVSLNAIKKIDANNLEVTMWDDRVFPIAARRKNGFINAYKFKEKL